MSTHKYLETHPWLTFQVDLERHLTSRSWMLLGEVTSKCSHIAGAPLSPEIAAEMHQVTLTKSVHGTASIEGNTLSEDEVRQRIEGDLQLGQSREYQGVEIDNIVNICNQMMQQAALGELEPLSVARVKEFNKLLLEGQPLKEEVVPGEVRSHNVSVGISHYRGAPAEESEYLLAKLVDWINTGFVSADQRPEVAFSFAVLKAIYAHVYLAWIHPFGDGNGRTARIIEFQLMIDAGAPSAAAHLLSNFYNTTRDKYLTVLDRISREEGFPIKYFIEYALEGLTDELRHQIQLIREHQYGVTWVNYLHQVLGGNSTTNMRQLRLMLDFGREGLRRSEIPDVSTDVRRRYASLTDKTLTRDLRDLVAKQLLVKKKDLYFQNIGLVAAFLPLVKAGANDI
ncbi:Fic family protein [Jonesiaceae bacterium BS-20]|uniref:Fic family protein n=1 Tax=Jonesiaceae bacterium BS-20 TaxID=3120821 RepID=A0AAU7DY37_9MICO